MVNKGRLRWGKTKGEGKGREGRRGKRKGKGGKRKEENGRGERKEERRKEEGTRKKEKSKSEENRINYSRRLRQSGRVRRGRESGRFDIRPIIVPRTLILDRMRKGSSFSCRCSFVCSSRHPCWRFSKSHFILLLIINTRGRRFGIWDTWNFNIIPRLYFFFLHCYFSFITSKNWRFIIRATGRSRLLIIVSS